MEASSSFLITLGATSLAVSWLLLLISAFRTEYAWGLFALLMPPVGYLYALFRLDQAGGAIAFAALGSILLFWGA